MTILHHVLMTQGKTMRTERTALDARAAEHLRPFVVELITGSPAVPRTRGVPGRPGFHIQCLTLYGPALFRIYGPAPDVVPEDGVDLPCIASFGVVIDEDEDAQRALWEALWKLDPDMRSAADRPDMPGSLPWSAAVTDAGIVFVPEAAVWVGETQRQIAWTLWSIRHDLMH